MLRQEFSASGPVRRTKEVLQRILMGTETALLSIVADITPAISPGSPNGALANAPDFRGSVSPVVLSATDAALRPLGRNDATVDTEGSGLHWASRK
jgi:hypothetical protein